MIDAGMPSTPSVTSLSIPPPPPPPPPPASTTEPSATFEDAASEVPNIKMCVMPNLAETPTDRISDEEDVLPPITYSTQERLDAYRTECTHYHYWEAELKTSVGKEFTLKDLTADENEFTVRKGDHVMDYTAINQNNRTAGALLDVGTVFKRLIILDELHKYVENVPFEPPVVSSHLPRTTSSHVNKVMSRMVRRDDRCWTGELDMQYSLIGVSTYEKTAVHTLGRKWKLIDPETRIDVEFPVCPDNYDSAQVKILSVFATIMETTVPTTKDIAQINSALTFTGLPKIPDFTHQMHQNLRLIFDQKPRFARLYWRLIVLYIEALIAEEQKENYIVTSVITSGGNVTQTRTEDGFQAAVRACVNGDNGVFITDRMLNECKTDAAVSILMVATVDGYRANNRTILPRMWVPIPGARVVILSPSMIISSRAVTCPILLHSSDIGKVIDYFAGHFRQEHLVAEMIKVAASLIMRPSGGRTLVQNCRVTLSFPPAALTPSLALALAEKPINTRLRNSVLKLEKMLWVGVIHRMQYELLISTMLEYSGIGTQLAYNKQSESVLRQTALQLASRAENVSILYVLAQSLSLRLGWGCVVSRMESDFDVASYVNNYITYRRTHPVQWSEWLPYGRRLPVTAGVLGLLLNGGGIIPKPEIALAQYTNTSNDNSVIFDNNKPRLFPFVLLLRQHNLHEATGWQLVNQQQRQYGTWWCNDNKKYNGMLRDEYHGPMSVEDNVTAVPFFSIQNKDQLAWVESKILPWRKMSWRIVTSWTAQGLVEKHPFMYSPEGMTMGREDKDFRMIAINPALAKRDRYESTTGGSGSSSPSSASSDGSSDGSDAPRKQPRIEILPQSDRKTQDARFMGTPAIPSLFSENVAQHLEGLKVVTASIGDAVKKLEHCYTRVMDAADADETARLNRSQLWRALKALHTIEKGTLETQTILRQRTNEFINALSLERPETFLRCTLPANRSILAHAVREVCSILLEFGVGQVELLNRALNDYEILANMMTSVPALTAEEFAAAGMAHISELAPSPEDIVELMLQIKEVDNIFGIWFMEEAFTEILEQHRRSKDPKSCRVEAEEGKPKNNDDKPDDGTSGNNGGNGKGNSKSNGNGRATLTRRRSQHYSHEIRRPPPNGKSNGGSKRSDDVDAVDNVLDENDIENEASDIKYVLMHSMHNAAVRNKVFGSTIISGLVRVMRSGNCDVRPVLSTVIQNMIEQVYKTFGSRTVSTSNVNPLQAGTFRYSVATIRQNIEMITSTQMCPINSKNRRSGVGMRTIFEAQDLLGIGTHGDNVVINISRLIELRQAHWETRVAACAMLMPGASIAEELRTMYIPDLNLSKYAVDSKNGWQLKQLFEHLTYNNAPPGLRNIFQIEARWVAEVCRDRSPRRLPTLCQVGHANKELYSYEMAALFLWWLLLPDDLYDHFLAWGWQHVDVKHCGDVIAELCNQVRMVGVGCSCECGPKIAHFLRKFGSLKGRRLGSADWEEEAKNSSITKTNRAFGYTNGPWNRDHYLRKISDILGGLTDRVVHIKNQHPMLELDEWWERRQSHTPGGSTSERASWTQKEADRLQKDPVATSSDRPNKKAVAESLDKEYPWNILEGAAMMSERCSTKPETGLKLRALHAASDESTVIASYASEGIEKAMSQARVGLMPLQEPTDVADWLDWHYNREPSQVMVSADYKDFNKEHSLAELMLVHLMMAQSYIKIAKGDAAVEKAACSTWMAIATHNRIGNNPNDDVDMGLGGLWSGTRDTARDNTFLNRAYMQLCIDWLNKAMHNWGSVDKIATCGDDSVIRVNDPIAAFIIINTLSQWWNLNPKKQMCSYQSSEFLQQMPNDEHGCLGSVCSMVAAMCSGQWYKAKGPSQDTAVDAISSQCYELGLRADNMLVTRYLAIRALQAYMKVQTPEGGKEKLEWWQYRHCVHKLPQQYGLFNEPEYHLKMHPLWCTPAELEGIDLIDAVEAPKPFWIDEPTKTLSGLASRDILVSIREKLTPQEQALLNKHEKHLLDKFKSESYGALHHAWLQKQRQASIRKNWPRRVDTAASYQSMHAEANRLEQEWNKYSERNSTHKFVNWLRSQLNRLLQGKPIPSKGGAASKLGITVDVVNLLEAAGENRLPFWVDKMCTQKMNLAWANRLQLNKADVVRLSPPLRALLLGTAA